MSELYVLEWSKRQGCFHIQRADHVCQTNMQAFRVNKNLNDYHIIAIGSEEKMHSIAGTYRKELYARDAE
jgi:hypothetical protein